MDDDHKSQNGEKSVVELDLSFGIFKCCQISTQLVLQRRRVTERIFGYFTRNGICYCYREPEKVSQISAVLLLKKTFSQ